MTTEAPAGEGQTTRERLLETAGRAFAKSGFEGATVRSICAEAGANVSAVNYHFGDKESLYLEVIRFAFEQLHERNPSALPSELPLRERLLVYVRGFLSRLLSAGESWHGGLLAREMANPGPALRQVVERFFRPQIESLEALMAEVAPRLDEGARRLHVLGLIAQCVFFRHARPTLDLLYGADAYGRDDLPVVAEHIVTQFLRGVGLPADEVTP